MSRAAPLLVSEFKRIYTRKKLVFIILLFLLLMIMGLMGNNAYKQATAAAKDFQAAEKIMFGKLQSYEKYSFQGLRLLFFPSPIMSLFHNSAAAPGLTARINPVITMSIFSDLKARVLALSNYKIYWDFAGIFLIFGSLFAMVIGYEIPRNKEYLKFLSSLYSRDKLLNYLVFYRYLVIMVTFILMVGVQLLLLTLFGLHLSMPELTGILVFTATLAVMVLFFLLTGFLMGLIRGKENDFSWWLVLVWFIFVFIVPGGLNLINWQGFENRQSYYRTEVEQLDIVSLFEKTSEKKEGSFNRDRIENERKIMKEYFVKDYPRIINLEVLYRSYFEERIRRHWRWSLLFPTTFYNSVCTEVSGSGYGSFLDFWDYVIKTHRGFVRFWIDRVFYHDPKEMVSFIKGDENLFQGVTRVPPHFHYGILITLGYSWGLYMGCFFGFKRLLRTYDDTGPFKKKELDFPVTTKKINPYFTNRPGLRDYLFNKFSGINVKRKPVEQSLHVTIDGTEVCWGSQTGGFRYICHPADLPGEIRGIDFIRFVLGCNRAGKKEKEELIKRFQPGELYQPFIKMSLEEKSRVLLEVLPYINGKVFLFYHTCIGLTIDHYIHFKNQMKRLEEKGAAIIYLSPETSVNQIQKKRNRDIIQLNYWVEQLESLEGMDEDEIDD